MQVIPDDTSAHRELAITFACQSEMLAGVVTLPRASGATESETNGPTTGLIIIVGGPQYRAGSHRQFVLLARAVAAAGTPVLRFDYRGMGDSSGELHTFENVNQDIAAAIDALQATVPSIQNVALWGLCDGASAALLYCHATQDDRVKGLCLLNPWVRSDASLARTQVKHYYLQRLQQKEFWVKLLRGGVAAHAFGGLMQNLRAAFGSAGSGADAADLRQPTEIQKPFQQRMAKAWQQFQGPILLILSGDDFTAKEFQEYASIDPAWKNYLRHPQLQRHEVPGVDHTFSGAASRQQAEQITLEWVASLLMR